MSKITLVDDTTPRTQDTTRQCHSGVRGLHSQIPLYSPLALFLKPTWHSALHAEEQEIKLRSALVCWADLLPPHCYLIIQELWNVLLYGSMQPECLCLPLMTAASQSFYLCMRGFKCVCVQCESEHVCVSVQTNGHTRWCYLHRQHTEQNIPAWFDTLGFELWTEKDLVGKLPKHYETQTRRHTSSLMFWCIQRANLLKAALSCIEHTCHDRSPWHVKSIPPHKRCITCNYAPLGPSYLSLLHVTRISSVTLSTLRCLPSAGFTNMLFQNIKNKQCCRARCPSKKKSWANQREI